MYAECEWVLLAMMGRRGRREKHPWMGDGGKLRGGRSYHSLLRKVSESVAAASPETARLVCPSILELTIALDIRLWTEYWLKEMTHEGAVLAMDGV